MFNQGQWGPDGKQHWQNTKNLELENLNDVFSAFFRN